MSGPYVCLLIAASTKISSPVLDGRPAIPRRSRLSIRTNRETAARAMTTLQMGDPAAHKARRVV